MPLKLYPPGARKRNRFYIARGTVGGRRIEVSTDATDENAARLFAAELEYKILSSRAPEPGEVVTFAKAAERYCAARRPNKDDQRRIDRLVVALGTRTLDTITRDSLVEAADALYPAAKASSRNRNVITPASSILHYAAENGWCQYRRIKRFKEPRPVTRAISRQAATALIAAARDDAKGLLLFLLHQGTRISDTIRLDWSQVDLAARTFRIHVSKTDEWLTLPLAAEAFFWLANRPKRQGRVFPYRNRWAAYKAIKPACTAAGIRFTPHMARHSVGTWLSADGASLKTIMGALGHRDAKSSLRYQAGEVDVIRAAIDRLRGRSGGENEKRKRHQ